MPSNDAALLFIALFGVFFIAAGPGMAQQPANLGDIGTATVTLYFYDNASGTKGAIVPMPDNPQQVNWDPALAAPGMYTFSHVPAGQWYYLEADHNGNKWYATFYMEENAGTVTRNVHIPPMSPVNATMDIPVSPTPAATVTPATSTPVPTRNESPARATPGMAFTVAAIAILLAALKRR